MGHRRITRSILSVIALAAVQAMSWGCTGPRKTAPSVETRSLSDEEFQAYLAEVDLVTVDEAYRAMLILADGEDPNGSFDERRQALESRGIARAAWRLQPDHVIDAGSVAAMVCKICRVRGGVNMRLFGRQGLGDRRYALRELEYRKMTEELNDYQYMTGRALFAMMRKADALMAQKGLYETQGIDLSDEADRDEQGDLIVPP